MNRDAGVSPTRRGVLFGILAVVVGCAAESDVPETRRRGEDGDPDYDAPDISIGGNMGGGMM